MEEELSKQREIVLALEDNWDDEGAEKVLPETFDRVEAFVKKYIKEVKENYSIDAPLPKIWPDGRGGLDIGFYDSRFYINVTKESNIAEYAANKQRRTVERRYIRYY